MSWTEIKGSRSDLAEQWHPTKNAGLKSTDVSRGSSKKVWWLCEKGHEWVASVNKRTNGRGCPFCAGRRVDTSNSLSVKHPEISKEWHSIKNAPVTPDSVTPGSGKKVWWKCGKGHEWQTVIVDRTSGTGCPFCAGRKVCDDNSLALLNPSIAREWHRTKNGSLTPDDVVLGSYKKVWWFCSNEHEWQASIANRTRLGSKCPYCSNQKIGADNSLAVLNPLLAKQWHPTKNGTLTPFQVSQGSEKRVWWQCENGHQWNAQIFSRSRGSGCPYCSGQKVCVDNCLATLRPDLAREWHPIKNKNLRPEGVTRMNGNKVWWMCPKGHEWQAVIASRSSGRGCPQCSAQLHTSFAEQAIYHYTQQVFLQVKNRYLLSNGRYPIEVDTYIPQLNCAIEYDSFFYHQYRKNNDEFKNRFLNENGILLVRVRESGLPELEPYGSLVIECHGKRIQDIELSIRELFRLLKDNSNDLIVQIPDIDIERDRIEIIGSYMNLELENSLASLQPKLASQWNYERNGDLTPKQVSKGSGQRVWWMCNEGHEWEAVVSSRTRGLGCPYCAGRRATTKNSFAVVHPHLVGQWHPTKNGNLTPHDVTKSSSKKVWWICGKGHPWKSTVQNRARRRGGCPLCPNENHKN